MWPQFLCATRRTRDGDEKKHILQKGQDTTVILVNIIHDSLPSRGGTEANPRGQGGRVWRTTLKMASERARFKLLLALLAPIINDVSHFVSPLPTFQPTYQPTEDTLTPYFYLFQTLLPAQE